MNSDQTVESQSPETGGLEAAALEAIENVNVEDASPLNVPRQLKKEYPVTPKAYETVLQGRREIRGILDGVDKRFLVVLGPCSIHDTKAAVEYAQRLAPLRARYADQLCIVMRVYFEKPRTTVGWKGLINDPHLNGTFDMQEGLRLARKLLLDIAELGLPSGTEMLDPFTPQYIDDLVSWSAIGARTTESQTHRQMASGLSTPVGFKNGTEGNLSVALDAMLAARSSHHFLGIDLDGRACVVTTRGNKYGHMVLRGGNARSNYDAESVASAAERLRAKGLPASLVVDCSHANSGKKFAAQETVWDSIIAQRIDGQSALTGAMLESHLFEGRQDLVDPNDLSYGVSVTDACIGWEKTEQLLERAHRAFVEATR